MERHDSSYNKKSSQSVVLKITPEMKKLRDVPERFLDNKKFMIDKFKVLGINDIQNWSEAGGEGITYDQLLRLPIYSDSDNLPENVVKKGSSLILKETPTNWDKYFEAIQQNFQVGFTSRYKTSQLVKEKRSKQANDETRPPEMYNDAAIEWDEIQQPTQSSDKSTPKYKMKFKEITDNEKSEIMKKIEDSDEGQTDNSMNMAGALRSAVGVNPTTTSSNRKILSIEELEGALKSQSSTPATLEHVQKQLKDVNLDNDGPDDFFKDENDLDNENQFAMCKENIDADDNDDEEVEFDQVDVAELKQQTPSATLPSKTVVNEAVKPEPTEIPLIPQKIIAAEQLELLHLQTAPKTAPKPQAPTQKPPSQTPATQSQKQPVVSQIPQPIPQSYAYQNMMQAQNDYQTQQMINQLNQDEIQNVIMQNSALRNQHSQYMQNYAYDNSSPDLDMNPFELLLSDDPTSQWFYKDPQGMIQGPFSCFDMSNWYNQCYFNEDLEISMDYANFFRLCDLRTYIQNSMQASPPQYTQPAPVQPNYMYGYGIGSPELQMQYNQMQGYMHQPSAYHQYSTGYSNAYSSYAQSPSAYRSTNDQTPYYPSGHMAEGAPYMYGPYYGHQ